MRPVIKKFASVALAALGIAAAVPSAWAETGNVTTAQVAEDGEANKSGPFHLLVLGLGSSDLMQSSDPNHSAEFDLVLGPSYKINSDWTLAGKFPFKQELSGYERALAMDSKIALAHSAILLNQYMKLTPSAAVRIPLSDQSRNEDTMYVGGQFGLELDNDLAAISLKNVSLNYTAVVGRNFYQYNTSSTGTVNGVAEGNIEYDFAQRVDLGYQFLPRWSVTSTGQYMLGMDYFDNVTGKFLVNEELDYQIAKAWSVGAGYSNSADVLQADGHDSNFAIYNPYTTTVYGVLSFTY